MKTLSLSDRANLLRPSPTLAITARAKQLKAEGKDVISFGVGEPDFDTPSVVVEAAIRSLHDGFTKYTPTPGIPALREAVAARLRAENGVSVTSDQIIVSSGAKQSLYNSMMTLLNPGDEVIVFAPYWMTYLDQIVLAGGVPVIVSATSDSGFIPGQEDINAAITPRTRAIVVNSPSNPTGAVFPESLLRWIGELAVKNELWLISDEIYEKLIYDAKHLSLASLSKDVADRTITITGCSKTYAMTGWRIGFAAAPLPVAKAMSNLQDQVSSNATSFAQVGALAAIQMDHAVIDDMVLEFRARRDLIVKRLNGIDGVTVSTPSGAFYVLPDTSDFFDGNDEELADFLLREALVATVPGGVFGCPGHIRLSYAASRKDIEVGTDRIKECLARLKQ